MGTRWWTRCRQFAALSARSQARFGDERYRRGLRRIADLPPEIGAPLDAQCAPLRVCKWIAWAPGPRATRAEAQHRRHEAMIAFRSEHARWPTDAEITAMTATVSAPAPTVDRKTRQVIDFVQTLEAGLAGAGVSEGEAAVLREAALMGFGRALG